MRGAARIRGSLRRLSGRLRRPGHAPSPARFLEDALLPAALTGNRADPAKLREGFRFLHDRERLAAIAAAPAADLGLSEIADAALCGRAPFFDRQIAGALPPDWLAVPDGGRWPLLPAACFDHADFTRHGDLRQLWELGRLQSAPTLLAAARVCGRREPAEQALRLIYDFRERNPVGWGPHWIAGLEAGLRIFSLLWSWALLDPHDDESTLLLAASLVENGRFVESHLSIKPVSNNHLIGEVAALYSLGSAMPHLADAARWRDLGRSLLDGELTAQLLPDGMQAEQAIEYHRFVLEFYLQALLWGRANGENLEPAWGDRLRGMLHPLAALTGPDGMLVSIGDDDCGRVIRLDGRPRRDPRATLAVGANLLGGDGLGSLASRVDGEALWLLGPEAASADAGGGPPAAHPLPAVEAFSDAGLFVSRFGEAVGGAAVPPGHLVFKAGPMGQGGAGHSHVDQLSLTLSLAGSPVLVDGGTYLYNGPQAWRDHFRGGSAHSILRVGGRDPAIAQPAPDRFGWAERCDARCLARHAGSVVRFWDATREGDRDASGRRRGVWRSVLQIPPGLLLVIDEVSAAEADADPNSAALPLELLWLCAPGIEPRWQPAAGTAKLAEPGEKRSGGRCGVPGMEFHGLRLQQGERTVLLAHFFAQRGLHPFHSEGQDDPPVGWFSRDYGSKEPVALTGLAGEGEGHVLVLSLLADPSAHPRLEHSGLENGPEGDFRLEISGELDETLRVSFRRHGEEAVRQLDWVEGLEIESGLALAAIGPRNELRALFAKAPRRLSYGGRDLLAEADAGTGLFFEKEWSRCDAK